MVATEALNRRRLWVGQAAFVSLECAVFIRYTNLIELGVAVAAVALLAPCQIAPFSARDLGVVGAVLFAILVDFDQWAYGSATSPAYSAGEISFPLSSVWPNLVGMPAKPTTSMPMWLLAAAAVITIAVRQLRECHDSPRSPEFVDVRNGAVLTAGWLGLWALYLGYTWTVGQLHGGTRRQLNHRSRHSLLLARDGTHRDA